MAYFAILACIVALTRPTSSALENAQKGDEAIPRWTEVDELPVGYFKEAAQLAQLRLEDRQAQVASLEKKAFAVLVAMAAVVAFLLSQKWCADALDWFRIVGVASCAIAFAICMFIARLSDVGMLGIAPTESLGVGRDKLADQRRSSGILIDQYESSLLYGTISHYCRAIAETSRTLTAKLKRFNTAFLFAAAGMTATAAWIFLISLRVFLGA